MYFFILLLFMEGKYKSKSRKISSYLPSDLCEDLSLNEDSSVDELNDIISPILKSRKLKSNKRRSSSFDFHDFHLNLIEIKHLDNRNFPLNTNTKFIKNLIQTKNKSVKKINYNINLLNKQIPIHNNIITINNKENNNSDLNQDYQNLIPIIINNNNNNSNNNSFISNNSNNTNIKHSILKKQKLNKNINNKKLNEKKIKKKSKKKQKKKKKKK